MSFKAVEFSIDLFSASDELIIYKIPFSSLSTMMFQKFVIFLFVCIFAVAYAKLVLTKAELKALEKFRPLVKNILTHGYQTTDSYLIRWLKAKKLNVEDAVQMLKEAQQWRKENNIDTILNEKFDRSGYIYTDDGRDYEGRTVFTSSIANFDIRKAVIAGKGDQYFRQTLYETEKAVSTAAERVYRSNGTLTDSRLVSLADLHGFNLRKHACLACLDYYTRATRVVEKNYPGISALEISINTPRIALPLLRFVLSIVSPETQAAIKVFGTNRTEWSEYLKTVIPEDQRTYQFGGTKPN